MPGIIPKEELAGFQRWEAGSFGSSEHVARGAPAKTVAPSTPTKPEGKPNAAPASPSPLAGLPTAEQIEQMHESAHAEGYQAGFEEGKTEGKAEGFAQGMEEGRTKGEEEGRKQGKAELDKQAARLSKLAGTLQTALSDFDQEMAEPLLDLAVEIAAQIIRGGIRFQRDAMLATIREAIDCLPLHHAHVQVHLHPDDATNVRELLGDQLSQQGTQLIEDSQISRGGCRVRAGNSEIDATLETRWRRVLENLGVDASHWTIAP